MVPSSYSGPSHHAYVSKRYQAFEATTNDPTASLSSKSSRSSKRSSLRASSSSIRSSISRLSCFSAHHSQDTTPTMPQPMTITIPSSARPFSTYSITSSQGLSSPLGSPLYSPMQSPMTSPTPLLHGMQLPPTSPSTSSSCSDDGKLSAVKACRPLSGDAGYSALRDDIQRRRRTLLVAMEMEEKRRSGSEGQWTAERSK